MSVLLTQGTVTLNLTTAGYPADRSGQDMWTVRREHTLHLNTPLVSGASACIRPVCKCTYSHALVRSQHTGAKARFNGVVAMACVTLFACPLSHQVNCSNVDFDFTNGPSELDCGSQCANIVVHDCLSYEGQSGSAIWSTVREGFHLCCCVLLRLCRSERFMEGQAHEAARSVSV